MTGLIEGFWGLEIFDFGIVLGGKILASIFLGSLISAGILLGIQNNLKIRDSSLVSRPRAELGEW